MRARRLQRPNRWRGAFVLAGKHKVSQGYSPAMIKVGVNGALKARASTPFEMTICKWFE